MTREALIGSVSRAGGTLVEVVSIGQRWAAEVTWTILETEGLIARVLMFAPNACRRNVIVTRAAVGDTGEVRLPPAIRAQFNQVVEKVTAVVRE